MAKTIKVDLDYRAINHMLNDPQGDTGRYIYKKAKAVQFAAKRQVGVRTGRLRNSIRIYGHRGHASGQEMYIGSSVPYAMMHHEGTRRHKITAKKKSYLKFRSGSKLVFRKAVNHPGTRPNRYLTDNLYLFYR
jgi:hypothetical protein